VDLVEQLVEKAEGLFIFASTVVKFIEGNGGPDYQLREIVRRQVKGLDGLYREVLHNALTKFEYPEDKDQCLCIIGTIILLRQQLSVDELGGLLDLPGDHVRGRLRNVQSVLIVPADIWGTIRTLHASFHDFLVDYRRSGTKTDRDLSDDFFVDPAKHHERIMRHCLTLITTDQDRGRHAKAMVYASRSWLYHMDRVLVHRGESGSIISRANDELIGCMGNLMSNSFNMWMWTLAWNSEAFETFMDLDMVVCRLKVTSVSFPCHRKLS